MQEIKLTWKGRNYSVAEKDTFALGEEIEDIISLGELSEMTTKPNFRRIARCYSTILNFAGANTTPAEIHTMMMDQIKGGSDADQVALMTSAIQTLVEILMDGAPDDEEEGGGKKPETASS